MFPRSRNGSNNRKGTNMARKRRGRGEGSIFQRADGQWVARLSLGYGPDGKRKRRTLYGKSKAEVAEKLRKLQHVADAGQLSVTGNLTIAQFLNQWLDATEPTVCKGTHTGYAQHVNNLIVPKVG